MFNNSNRSHPSLNSNKRGAGDTSQESTHDSHSQEENQKSKKKDVSSSESSVATVDWDDEKPEDSEVVQGLLEQESLKTYIQKPMAGSIISMLAKCKTKKDVENLAKKKILANFATLFLMDDLDLGFFYVLHLVLNKQTSLDFLESKQVQEYIASEEPSSMEFASKVYAMEISKRSDFRKLIYRISTYHPSVASKLSSLFTEEKKIIVR